ncbi:HAD domain-containing protein [Massilia sp. YIM B02763]|uniref:HAD domain-containing protein n=1 Tax=Massilia sp. YIM B02763 TaxID=3050130 RepID=UPI0025B68D3A|nr:HAD domain-containing protein [Massilia sp. YIM B02763]MDN4052261.1 HAD domain-containing protein [Massilia sp. YIM B02763]
MLRPLIFLDFDDVLAIDPYKNSAEGMFASRTGFIDDAAGLWRGSFHEPARSNLLRLHDEFEPEYIITSSWTTFLSREQISKILLLTNLKFVDRNLHYAWTTIREDNSYRLTEIDNWLKINNTNEPRPYLILDDDLNGQSLSGSHLEINSVLCEPWAGFTAVKLKLAQLILRRQV